MGISDFLVLAITSGLVAGVITTLGNIFISIWEKKSDANLENMKYRYSLNNYRYMELSKILDAVIAAESDYNAETDKWSSEHGCFSIDLLYRESNALDNNFRKMLPLLDTVYRQEIQRLRKEMLENMEQFYEKCLDNELSEDLQPYAASYMIGVKKFCTEIIETLQKQLIELIVQ